MVNESALDPLRKELNPKVFGKDRKMLPAVRKLVMDRLRAWIKRMGLPAPGRVTLLGSMAGYRWTETSDLDVNVVMDGATSRKEIDRLVPLLPNGWTLPGTAHEVNYYMLTQEEYRDHAHRADAEYDIEAEAWVKEEDRDSKALPFWYVSEIARLFCAGARDRIAEYEQDVTDLRWLEDADAEAEGMTEEELEERRARKREEIRADLDAAYVAHMMLASFRHKAFDAGSTPIGNSLGIEARLNNQSINNLIYKYAERVGVIKRLMELENERKRLAEKG